MEGAGAIGDGHHAQDPGPDRGRGGAEEGAAHDAAAGDDEVEGSVHGGERGHGIPFRPPKRPRPARWKRAGREGVSFPAGLIFRTASPPSIWRMRLVASQPSMTGIFRSMKIRSGRSTFMASIAC